MPHSCNKVLILNKYSTYIMTTQVLPPDLLDSRTDKIETREPQAYFKPSSLKDGESEEFRLLGHYGTGHCITGYQYASEAVDPKTGELRFNGYVVTRTHPGNPTDLARETDWSKPDRPKIDGSYVKPRKFLAWVAMSAKRSRIEVLFIEQKSLREQLSEIMQDEEDFNFTKGDGLANFTIKITRKGTGLETSYTLLPKVRPVPEKIKKQWTTEKDAIWLANYFEGKDPFDGKQVEGKGLPAGGVDKNGATVVPASKNDSGSDESEF
jgi:hypothetical protein